MKTAILLAMAFISIPMTGFSSCNYPCEIDNPDASQRWAEPCVRSSYSEDVTPRPQAWSQGYMSEVVQKAINFVGGYFSIGHINPGTKSFWRFHFLQCCEIDGEYKVGEIKIFSVNPVVSGVIDWVASSHGLSLLSGIADQIANGFAGAFPAGVVAQIKDYIESWIPSLNIGNFIGAYQEDYTEEKRKDDCKGCPNEDTIWTGFQAVVGSVAGATLSIPAYKIQGYGIPSIQVKVLEGRLSWRKRGSLYGGYNRIDITGRAALLLFSYQIGGNAPVLVWGIRPTGISNSSGHSICNRW